MYLIPLVIFFAYLQGGWKNIKIDTLKGDVSNELYLTIFYTVIVLLELLVLYQYDIIYVLRPYKYGLTSIWTTQGNSNLVYMLYQIIFSHYCYSILKHLISIRSTIKNDLTMFTHHLVTMGLVYYAYNYKLEIAGVYVMFIHDVSDIFLHGGKYVYHTYNNWSVIPIYLVLMTTWIYFRLCCIPYFMFSLITESQKYTVIAINRPFIALSTFLLYLCHILWTYKLLCIGARLI
jgi:hypothetical protein